jgi:hypothetical protein
LIFEKDPIYSILIRASHQGEARLSLSGSQG